MDVKIEKTWKEQLSDEFGKPYFSQLATAVRAEYSQYVCFPPAKLIFNAFNLCPFDKVKVVILGQDPYHEPGQAHGLSFSVLSGTAFPPSLQNIFKEINGDIGTKIPPSGDLTRWAEQGVLLLNATLSVRAHQANSHSKLGWQTFTDAAIMRLSKNRTNIVFMLWGGYARNKKYLIDTSRHCILEAVHPSPLSANKGGWFGNHHFSKCNEYLLATNQTPIEW